MSLWAEYMYFWHEKRLIELMKGKNLQLFSFLCKKQNLKCCASETTRQGPQVQLSELHLSKHSSFSTTLPLTVTTIDALLCTS